MAVMRVEKNSNYTVMVNYHLRDKRLSLKAKGLLSVMISLPSEWDYTLAGLPYISKEGVSAIRAAIQELEENGYVTRARLRNEAGQLGDTEYTIYEFPQNEEKTAEPSSPPQAPVSASADVSENVEPVCGNPILEKPILENPTLEKPTSENRMQKNTDTSNPNQSNIHPSIPEATEPAAQTTWTNNGFIVEEPILEEPTTVSPLRRDADSLTEQQKFLSEPTSIPGMRRLLSFDGLVAFRCFQFPSSFGKHFLLLFLPLCCSRLGCGFFQLFVPFLLLPQFPVNVRDGSICSGVRVMAFHKCTLL